MLETGDIRVNEAMLGSETRTQAVWHRSESVPSHIRIGADFWNEGEAAAAFMIAHEYGHVIQRQLKGLIYDNPEARMSNSLWNNLTAGPTRNTDIGYLFFGATQDDANRYACSVTTPSSTYTLGYCGR
jgi:hypothetical protein